jgi:transcriptional regulator with XRE-family HTH domain
MREIDRHVGARIVRVRRFMGWTQSDLAGAIGVSFQQIQRYEAGGATIYAARLGAIADATGADVEYFFDGSRAGSEAPNGAADVVLLFASLSASARQQLLGLAGTLLDHEAACHQGDQHKQKRPTGGKARQGVAG